MRPGQYFISAKRGRWRVCLCGPTKTGPDGTVSYETVPVPGEDYPFSRREDALRRSYELNGWKWPPRPRQSCRP